MSSFRSDPIICLASAIQEQFWLLNQMHPESSAYNIPLLFRIQGRLDCACLERSINEIIRRHGVFRTFFTIEDGTIFQKIEPELVIGLQRGGPVSETEINRMLRDEVRRPFTLSELPLVRFKLFRLTNGEHLFLVVMHHIITDLRTKDLFVAELSTLYGACVGQNNEVLPVPATQYSEFSRWQKNWLAGDECTTMVSYWKERLEGQTALLDLPLKRNRPALVSLRGEALPFHLDAGLTAELKLLGRKHSVNIFLMLLSAYAVLLFRYSGQARLTIGVPLTNRRRDKYKNTMGCFVNILPLALTFSEGAGFLELLGQVRLAMLGAHRNQDVPFELLANKVSAKKDSSYNPLFQTAFTFEPPATLTLAGLEVESIPLHSGGSQLDIFLTLWEAEDGIQGHFEYNTDLLDESMIRQVADNYRTLLREIVRDCDRPVSTLPLLSALEKKRQVVDWNATGLSRSQVSGVHRLIEKQVEKTPDAIAAIFEGRQLSYGELNQRANRLAHFLSARGVKKGELVAVYMDRSLDMLVALIAVMKAGAAYVPLDPGFPEDRILYMISHSRISVMLTRESLRHSLSADSVHRIFMDTDREAIGRESRENPAMDVSPDDLAYVIYTSGSTGRPKGVMVHHGAVVNFLCSMAESPGLNSEDVLLAVTTLSFDIAVLELFLPLTVGARTIIANRETALDGSLLREALERHRVTVLQATPVTWRLLISAGWNGGNGFKVLCGGEALPADLASRLMERSSSVWNMYGPTETTVWSTCSRVTEGRAPVCVGRPIDNTRMYILDKWMQPVPLGVSGTLFIGGTGVSRGYLNQPDLTAEKFVGDPFDEAFDGKIYNTGDLARYHPDGTIEVMGRSDFQVKINGFRIETGEIETVLGGHPQVSQAVVSVHEFEPGDTRLVGYYTHANGSNGLVAKLRLYLAEKLPDYMVPSIIMPLDTLPMTPNGKVDRKNLPVPRSKRSETGREYLPAQNEIEEILSGIWCQVLKLDRVGIGDNFFDIGGNSLLGVRVVGQAEKILNRKISVLKLFQYSTIEQFAGYLSCGTSPKARHKKVQEHARLRRRSAARRRVAP